MKRFLSVLFLFGTVLWGISDRELAIDINLAGKQRMLSQRIAKEVLMIVQDIDKEEATKRLQKDMELFDRTLRGLQSSDKGLGLVAVLDQDIQSKLKKVDALWRPMKDRIQKILSGKYSQEDVDYILHNNVQLLDQMNEVVTALVAYGKKSKTAQGQAINLAGKERMLSQRIAKDRLWLAYDPSNKEAKEDLKRSIALFERILYGLEHGDKELGLRPTKAPWILKELDRAKSLWKEFKTTLDAQNKKELKRMVALSDALLAQMDKITKLYEAQYNRQKKISSINSVVKAFVAEKERQKHVINLAGKQRMLTQKMTKEALLSALGKEKATNLQLLREDMELYDRTLRGFEHGDEELNLPPAKDPTLLQQIAKVHELWDPFKKHVQNYLLNQNVKDLSYIVKNNEALLARSNELVQTFKRIYPTNNFLEEARKEIVDIAGRQRMLTQKMTKEKLLVLLGVQPKINKKKLQETIELFDTSLHDLMYGNKERLIVKPSNKELVAQFQKVKSLWDKLKPLYEKEKINDAELVVIIKGNPVLLREMDKAVYLCETVTEY